jgi:hypothetical protein
MTFSKSKHVAVIKEELVFGVLLVAVTSACAGVYINISGMYVMIGAGGGVGKEDTRA